MVMEEGGFPVDFPLLPRVTKWMGCHCCYGEATGGHGSLCLLQTLMSLGRQRTVNTLREPTQTPERGALGWAPEGSAPRHSASFARSQDTQVTAAVCRTGFLWTGLRLSPALLRGAYLSCSPVGGTRQREVPWSLEAQAAGVQWGGRRAWLGGRTG